MTGYMKSRYNYDEVEKPKKLKYYFYKIELPSVKKNEENLKKYY